MPPTGLKYATVGLTGPLNTCVRSYDIITPGSRDQHVLLTKINIEKMRLVAWGRAVGVCTATDVPDIELPPSESLLRPDIRVALFEILNSIQLTFTDADRLVSQYGLQQNLANSTQQQFLRGGAGSEDFPGSIRWCLKDQALDLLASHLHDFNNSLLALIPDRAADANRLVEAEIDSVDDVDRLRMVEDASSELNADICGMAIIRRILFKNGQLRSRADAPRHSVLLQYFSGLSSVPPKDAVELAQPSNPPRRSTPLKDMVEPAEPSNPPRQGTPSQTPRSFQFTPPVPTQNALEAEEPDLSSYHVIQPQDPEGYTYGQNLAPIVAALRAADKNRFIDSCNQPYRLAGEVRKARYMRTNHF